MKSRPYDMAQLIQALLPLRGNPVGIRLLETEEAYQCFAGTEVCKPLGYCQAVRAAFCGHAIKLSRKTSGCQGSSKALGLAPCSQDYYSGVEGARMGLYDSCQTAAKVAAEAAYHTSQIQGVYVAPLSQFQEIPDVILLLCDSRDAMRILQGYTYHYGLPQGMQISGNQAVCVECTMLPIRTSGINLSMLCAGTRHKARWRDDDIMIGIAGQRFASTVDGILHTVNPIEYPDRKRQIEQNLENIGQKEIEIDYEKTYFKRWDPPCT